MTWTVGRSRGIGSLFTLPFEPLLLLAAVRQPIQE